MTHQDLRRKWGDIPKGEKLANDSMKQTKLKRSQETKHLDTDQLCDIQADSESKNRSVAIKDFGLSKETLLLPDRRNFRNISWMFWHYFLHFVHLLAYH